MRGPAVQTIVIAAGGTGGHFFPAEALAAELLARGHRIALMTDARSGAMKSKVFAGHEQFVLPGAGIAGRGVWRGIKAVVGLGAGAVKARGLLARLNAAAVVGFGGYPCVSPILGAGLLKRRPVLVLHEQNAVLGRANRFLAKRVNRLALSFAGTERVPSEVLSWPGLSRPSTTSVASTGPGVDGRDKPGHDAGETARRPATVITGNPVRPAITSLADTRYSEPTDRICLVVLGGSLGARVFSDIVPPALASLPDALRHRLTLTQQCRAEDLDRVRAAYAAADIEADLSPFFPDVAERLAGAHLVIARAGASTVAELAVAGRPSVLVPLPGAIDDHQSANARALAQAGAARVMPQPSFTPDALASTLTELLSAPATLSTMAAAARTQARPGAAARLADLVETLMSHSAAELSA
jgi:UDP-N-acetylglucosamine--N-acetylmuramyl-(pentapeptide) pyrophosphoryl-undecaprenol N-acetylglucosamine transferase